MFKKTIALFLSVVCLIGIMSVSAADIEEQELFYTYDAETQEVSIEIAEKVENVSWPSFKGTETVTEIAPRAIIGDDDTEVVSNTKAFPYSPIARILVTFPDGRRYTTTGFMIAPSVAIVSGYMVYDREKKQYASAMEVTPGYDNGTAPFGTAHGISWKTNSKFIAGDNYYNYGIVTLKESIGNKCGYFGYKMDPEILGKNVWITGYSNGIMRKCKGPIASLDGIKMTYQIDADNGVPGAPIYRNYDGLGYTVVGIHAGVGIDYNCGTAITQTVMNFIKANS